MYAAAKSKKFRQRQPTIQALFAYWQETLKSARRFNISGAARPVGAVITSSRTKRPSVASVEYDFYVMQGTNVLRGFKGFISDFALTATKGEILKDLADEILSWITANYGRRSQLYQQATKRKGLVVELRAIEGI